MCDLVAGELVRGYVKAISARGCFVSLSHTLDGFVGLKHISDDFIKVEQLPSLVSVGQLVVARILSASAHEGSPRVELSLKQTLVDGGHYVAPEKVLRFEELAAGLVLSGEVRNVHEHGALVSPQNRTTL